jgi:hypothetical protein
VAVNKNCLQDENEEAKKKRKGGGKKNLDFFVFKNEVPYRRA